MIALMMIQAASTVPESPFVGNWTCRSAFQSEAYLLDLKVDGKSGSAAISNSNDAALPNGPVRLWGKPQVVEHHGRDENNLFPERRWDGQVINASGYVSFSMLWDQEDGLSVNLRQYFSDGSPSKLLGALTCVEKNS